MARASTFTLLPLDRFARVVGIHPLHFNQITVAALAPASVCESPLLQYAWQEADRLGREELAQAVSDAEEQISRWLGYKPLPTWEPDELVMLARPANPGLYNINNLNVRGLWQTVRSAYGYVLTGGQETKTLIGASTAIVYSDSNGDGYDETATITVATTVTDPEEIAVYYPGKDGDSEWEIRPIDVSISGGNATITCRREQLVLEDLMESYNPDAVDGLVDANFLTTVDVYRHWTDPQTQAEFAWENNPNLCGCTSNDCTQCTFSTQNGCITVRNSRLGFLAVAPGAWDADNDVFDSAEFTVGRQPDRVRIWYKAGWRNMKLSTPNIRMDDKWERAIARLALTLLDRPLCACNQLEHATKYWKEDLALNISNPSSSSSVQLTKKVLDNPLGTTRGAIHAWELISRDRIGEGL